MDHSQSQNHEEFPNKKLSGDVVQLKLFLFVLSEVYLVKTKGSYYYALPLLVADFGD